MIVTRDPLRGRMILVAAGARTLEPLQSGLEALGAEVLPFPVIEARPVPDPAPLDAAIRALPDFDWIVFTSSNGVAFFVHRARELPGAWPPGRLPRVCAIGPGTAAAASAAGLPPDLVPGEFVAEGVFDALARRCGGERGLRGRRILIPRAERARAFLPEALTRAGARVDVVPCYRTLRAAPPPETLARLREKTPDLLVFTSASTVRNMIEILGQDEGRKLLCEARVAVIGPVTGKEAEASGKRADIIPGESTVRSLIEAVGDYFARASPNSPP